jgi:hypothetical protein
METLLRPNGPWGPYSHLWTHQHITAIEPGGIGTDVPSVVSTGVPRQATRPAGGGGLAGGGRLDGLRRHRGWAFALVVVALLTQMAVAMVTAARQQSPTTDEPVYIGAAVIYLEHAAWNTTSSIRRWPN